MPNRLGEFLWDALLAIAGAAMDLLFELTACIALGGLIMRRERHEPFEPADCVVLACLVVVVGLLARSIVRSKVRSLAGWGKIYRLPEGTVAPTASWAHVVTAAVLISLSPVFWTIKDAMNPDEPVQHGAGIGFLVVPIGFLMLRVVFRIRHRLNDHPDA